jgi:hypothetical protein
MKKLLLTLLLIAAPCMAAVVTPASGPNAVVPGYVISAEQFNQTVVDAYTYINNNVVAVLNVVDTKGDLYAYNGSSLIRQGVGSNGQVLQADDSTASGVKWATYTGAAPLTTKGDLLVYTGATITRLPVGTNGYALSVDSSEESGLEWRNFATEDNEFPAGTVTSWSPVGAGTSTIPTGWVLCDGNNGTPNLIGKFVIGTRPNGSSSSPASGGYGAYTVNSTPVSTTTHTHTISTPAFTSQITFNEGIVQSGTGSIVATRNHAHSVGAAARASGAATLRPSDYALVYIMKQ